MKKFASYFLIAVLMLASCGETQNQAWLLADKATEAMKDGDWQSAETLLTKAVEIDPGFAEAHLVRGRVLEQLDRQEDALKSYFQALLCYNKRIEKKSRDMQRYVDRAFLKLIEYDMAGFEADLQLAEKHGLQPTTADVIRQNATQEIENWRTGTPVISPNELAGR
jgi:tetratricopeptide (TPR) repeat protein